MRMSENHKLRRRILLCALLTLVAVVIFTFVEMSVKLHQLSGAGTFYQFVAEDGETETDVDEEVYINENKNTVESEQVYINQEEDIDSDESVYINQTEGEDSGKEVYINPDTDYKVFVEDSAQLLDAGEKRELASAMEDITAYGNAIFKTTDSSVWNTASYAGEYYREKVGTDSGILLLIDMDNRMLWIHCDGDVYRVVTESYADTITDNVYPYATGGDYYQCAVQVYGQAFALLEGNRIAQPMKYISNALLAMILALLLNYGLVCFATRIGKPRRREMLGNAGNYFRYTEPQAFFVRESRTYRPRSSGSSGGSRSGSGSSRSSGGSRGGGRSGGGGGHRF